VNLRGLNLTPGSRIVDEAPRHLETGDQDVNPSAARRSLTIERLTSTAAARTDSYASFNAPEPNDFV
jgi:hypothetical protein